MTNVTQETESPERQVTAVDLHDFEGSDVWQESDERARLRGYFPLSPGTPNASGVAAEDLMVVSFELGPGNRLPTHRDGNEELLVVTEGTVEAAVGDETVAVSAGECVVVPEMVPHGVANVGDGLARVVGFFPDDELTSTFDAPLQPFGTSEHSVGGRAGPDDGTGDAGRDAAANSESGSGR